MANRFANLEGSKKISEDFNNINIGFDRVQAEMDTKGTPADAQAKADAAKAAAIAAAAADLAAHKARGADEHPTAKGNAAGFMSAADKLIVDGRTSTSTPDTLMQRDAAGRAKVAAPAATDDIARKAETDAVQANLDSHASDTNIHVTAADHTKLNGIAAGAEVNQNAFAVINDVEASSKSDTVTFVGGVGITVSTNPTTKQVTVTATGEATPGAHAITHLPGGTDVIPDAVTGGLSGLMSGADAKFVRQDGESKTGAQAKADAAEQAANEYTDQKVGEIVIDDASLTQKGIVQLSNATESEEEGEAATPKAVNTVRQLAAEDATVKADAVQAEAQTALDNHANTSAANSEPHGMRIRSGKLEYYDGSIWTAASSGIDLTTTFITYNVNASTGNDSNDGLTTSTAFKTINKALSLIPPIFNNPYTIHIAAGTYVEDINIAHKQGNGYIDIIGPTTGSPAILSGRVSLMRVSISVIYIRYLTINAPSNVTAIDLTYVKLARISNCVMTTSSTQSGITISFSNAYLTANTISNKQSIAIYSSSMSYVFSDNNSGSGNGIGLGSYIGSTIVKLSAQPGGTTAEAVVQGGLIRS
ncbi:tail fiber protein [Paenibacillus sp. 11B]|uniref:tail fiber protein n=1 Tax=Paenibacillus sp. 11B TaxID=3060965 RepID=UPI002654DFD7|nr:tail fiber protein [Paenibacillus sp. 11B]MDN8588731.1 tail fiber protein [Paenibacillus sp. 11B]MDN8590805.1 tail fiber protein [Paenibacillus sp. 11B]